VVDILPALEKEAFNRRLIFGPFEYAKFTSGRYSLEYSFTQEEAVPYLPHHKTIIPVKILSLDSHPQADKLQET
jgi:hypothetical protein